VAQQAWLVGAMRLGDCASAATTGRALQCAFNRQDELAGLGQVGLEDTDIGNIERDGDEGLLGHGDKPFRQHMDRQS
jgi:hypothetical protein